MTMGKNKFGAFDDLVLLRSKHLKNETQFWQVLLVFADSLHHSSLLHDCNLGSFFAS